MPTFNTDNFVQTVLTDVSSLAATLFKNYAGQAETDARAFIQASKDRIAEAASLYQQGQIDQDDLEDIIHDQKALAELAGVSLPTIQRMEASTGNVRGVVETLIKVVEAFDRAGVELIGEQARSDSGGRGVRLKEPGPPRRVGA